MKTVTRVLLFFLVCFSFPIQPLRAQTAGNNTFDFLSLASSARVAALGGNNAFIHDDDINLAVVNPSLITPQMHNNLALNYSSNYAKINLGNVAIGRNFKRFGSMVGNLQFIDYGNLNYSLDNGLTIGQFKAAEYAVNVGWGKMLDSVFSIGANFKFIYSNLGYNLSTDEGNETYDFEPFRSVGVAVDVAGSYIPNKNTCASLIFRNIGRQLTPYTSNGVQPLPFEIQAGFSRRLAHLPFRLSVLLQHLEKWDLTYQNTNEEVDPFTGQTISKSSLDTFTDKALRHIVIGGEFIPARFLTLRMGYNFLRRKELKIDTRPGTVGFSFGLGLNVSKFSFSYTRAAYHIVGARNYITLVTNLGGWSKK